MMPARNSEALPPSHGERTRETPGRAGGCGFFQLLLGNLNDNGGNIIL
jgi:hypothetical protein